MKQKLRQLLKTWKPTSVLLRSVGRAILLAAAVGVVAGCGAVVFQLLCDLVLHYTLVGLAGYEQGSPVYDRGPSWGDTHVTIVPWLLLVVPTIGGLISGWLVFTYAPEAEGHGTDSAIDAFHNKRGVIRSRVPIIKLLASAITLGTGGSGGREGPIAQIGAGFGSFLGTRMGLTDSERRILMVAGLGAGIGAIFHAPLAGAIFAVEVLYADPEFESDAMIPAFIATTLAYCVFNISMDLMFDAPAYRPLFEVSSIQFRNPLLLIPLTLMCGLMSVVSLIYVRTFYGLHWLFKRMSIRSWLKPGVGAFLTGLVALTLYYSVALVSPDSQHDVLSVLSFGYGFLQDIFVDKLPADVVPAVVVLLMVAVGKILTTSLTIGSGGSGGVFGPSMVIGGCLGAIVGLVFKSMFPSDVHLDVFVILGMASFFAAAANTPVSTLIMVTEMTASYELLLPAMWVCALSYLVSRQWTIFHMQVGSRVDSGAHRGDFLVDVLRGMTVRDATDTVGRTFVTVLPGMLLRDVLLLFADTQQVCFPVVDRNGKYFGLFSLNNVRQFLYDSAVADLAVALDLTTMAQPLRPDMDLNTAIERFAETEFEELPVIDPEQPDNIVGLLRRQDLIAAYNTKLIEVRLAAKAEG
ncbi:MAG: CBS domain-containing protein [Phycisphaera sp.]|nr:CBS domain-containing protein [Phycisphaera sp.]